jgi:hypothetical protein
LEAIEKPPILQALGKIEKPQPTKIGFLKGFSETP